MEHNTALSPVSGTGAAGTVYTESLTWPAPPIGTGTISFWEALNAVIAFDVASGVVDHWNTASLVLEEDTSTVTTTAIHSISNDVQVNIYPNPTTDFVQVELNNATAGYYQVKVYDAEGHRLWSDDLTCTGNSNTITINTSAWASGIYMLQLTNCSQQRVVKVVKR